MIRLLVDDGPMPESLPEAVESASRGDAVLAGVRSLPSSYLPTSLLLDDAGAAARTSSMSVHDGLYVALAKSFGGTLVTRDERLRRRARMTGRYGPVPRVAAAWAASRRPGATDATPVA